MTGDNTVILQTYYIIIVVSLIRAFRFKRGPDWQSGRVALTLRGIIPITQPPYCQVWNINPQYSFRICLPGTELLQSPFRTSLEFVFQEQSYSSLHSGRSLAWDYVCGDINDPCGVIADFCGVIADPCDNDRRSRSLHDLLSIKHC